MTAHPTQYQQSREARAAVSKNPMQPTSNAQYDATVKSGIPELERLREGLWALPTAVPYGSVPYTLTYLVLDTAGGVHVIDPGWDSVDNWGALAFALKKIGRSKSDVASIVVTHLHADHTGMVERLRVASGATVTVHRTEQAAIDLLADGGDIVPDLAAWGAPEDRRPELWSAITAVDDIPVFQADRLVDDGDVLDIPGRTLTVMHTPGHTTGAICLRDDEASLLFTGDTVLPSEYPGLGLGAPSTSNPIADYLDSLARLSAFDEHEVAPGHGYRFTGLLQRTERIALHHRRRTDEVERALLARPTSTVWEIAAQLTWTAGWPNLHGFYLQSALAQTAMHVDLLRQ